jgi:hypothetical protein
MNAMKKLLLTILIVTLALLIAASVFLTVNLAVNEVECRQAGAVGVEPLFVGLDYDWTPEFWQPIYDHCLLDDGLPEIPLLTNDVMFEAPPAQDLPNSEIPPIEP